MLVHVARDGQRAQAFERAIGFVDPKIQVMNFPAWDCQPYDRASPTGSITAQRMTTLARLARTRSSEERPRILFDHGQRHPAAHAPAQAYPERTTFSAAPGNVITMQAIVDWLEVNGFMRTGTVHETGEYAVRGGILDL